MNRRFPRRLTPFVVSLGSLVLGCGGGGGDGGTPPPTSTIAKASANNGDAQSGRVGQPLATPLSVVVTEGGSASSGTTVAWSTTASGGSVDPASAVTDANGIASSTWTLGTVSGSQTAHATLSGASGSPVSFTATAGPDAAATLADAGGNGQSGAVNTQLAAPVQAKVADRFGNGVPGIGVGWVATGGTVSAGSVATDAAGISGVTVTLGGTAGPIRITATSGGLTGSPLTFTATANTGATNAVTVVNDRFSPAAITVPAGTTVIWSWVGTAQNHNVAPDATEPTRSGNPVNAPHTYQFTFNTPGTYLYHCEVHGAAGGIGMSGTITVQ
jgi:plastocyanin